MFASHRNQSHSRRRTMIHKDWTRVLEDPGFVPEGRSIDQLVITWFVTNPLPSEPRLAVSVSYHEMLFDRMVFSHRAAGRQFLGYEHAKWMADRWADIPAEWRQWNLVFPATVVKDARDHRSFGGYNHRYFPVLSHLKDGGWHLLWRGIGCDRLCEIDQLVYLAK